MSGSESRQDDAAIDAGVASARRRPLGGARAMVGCVLAFAFATCVAHATEVVGDAAAGKARYAVCQACHGVSGEGNWVFNAPPLAGQDDWYLARQIRSYKSGARAYDPRDVFGQPMKGMVALLPDEKAIADLTAYVRTLPDPTFQASVAGDVERGRELFAVCAQCHAAAGEGRRTMNAPRIARLPDWYVLRQMKNFLERIRGDHPADPYGAQMRPMVRAILPNAADEQPLRDVAAYVHSLE